MLNVSVKGLTLVTEICKCTEIVQSETFGGKNINIVNPEDCGCLMGYGHQTEPVVVAMTMPLE